jgi:colanic acid/amylovoran biosynthesis glycosyltransferase
MPVVASYCTTFLKPEMLHIYRQVSGLREFETFVIAKERKCEAKFPFDDVEIHERVRSNFIRRFWLKYIRKEPPIVYRGEYGVLNRILEARNADLMHVYFGHTGVHLLPVLKRWPKPTVVSFHGMDVQPREDQPGYIDRLRDMLQFLPMVMARSKSLKARLIELGCPEEKIRLNRTAIPADEFPVIQRPAPAPGEPWHLVQACRLIEKKGLDLTLRVFAAFCAEHPGSTMTIAGEGELRETLAKQAVQLGIADQVTFAGFLGGEELRDLFHRSHLFIHPSRVTADKNQEGIPNSMLEAMATGLPVLATLHGGIPEAVENGVTGLLVPEDDEAALLENLRELTADFGRWQTMGAAAGASIRENFDVASQIARLEGHYRELMEMPWPPEQ